MSKVASKQPSKKLREKIGDVANHIRNCATAVNEALVLGKQEGFSEKEIGSMIREQLKQLGYDPRSIRRALPSSIKDLSKVKKGYLAGGHDNDSINMDEDKMSSSENSNNFDENRQIMLDEKVKELQAKVNTLTDELALEQTENDLNKTELCQLQAELNEVRTLIIYPDQLPPDYDQVFNFQNDVLLVDFQGTEVLDIRVAPIEEADEQV